MELERPEAICGLESGTQSRLRSTRGHCACRKKVAFFGLRFAGTQIACPNRFSSVFSWLQICRHRGDHESDVCVVLTALRSAKSYAAIPLPATAHFIDPDRILSNSEPSAHATRHLANRRRHGCYLETGWEDINGNLPQADFWTGTTSG